VLPTSECEHGEYFHCNIDIAPGTSAAIRIVNGSNFTAESVEVTFATGEKESIEPKSAPAVPKCPIGSVSNTGGTAKCVVPKLKGKKLAAVETALRSAHCAVGKIKKARSTHVKKGSVISQSPSAGKSLPSGAAVSLTVSRGH
jgi:eukaryotic-like serine/threonine-protein kinase